MPLPLLKERENRKFQVNEILRGEAKPTTFEKIRITKEATINTTTRSQKPETRNHNLYLLKPYT
jgi:hypothetical protein